MKTQTRTLIAMSIIFTTLFLITSCKKDRDDNVNYPISGTWLLLNADVDAIPKAGATITEAELETTLADYTFFAPNSQVVFTQDSVTLTATLDGSTQPTFKLPYVIDNGILTISGVPIPSLIIEGEVDVEAQKMEFELTPKSYMSILQFISYTFPDFKTVYDQIATAHVEYTFKRIN